jgi:predicted membrane channel-forming protein YqfA (hemolysin III family)
MKRVVDGLAPWLVVFLFIVAPMGALFEVLFFKHIMFALAAVFLIVVVAGAVMVLIANIAIWRGKI